MKYAIGVDIGGTKIEAILANQKGKILDRYRTLTESHKPKKQILNNIFKAISKVKTKKIAGIGVGIPGISKKGKIVLISNIPKFKNLNLQHLLEKRFRIPVKLENDANCFALAEFLFGAGKRTTNMVGVIIGTGVGGGIIINKKLYSGNGFAGEIGHTIIDPSGIRDNCGNIGDLESWCSGPHIVQHYKKEGGKMNAPDPQKIFAGGDPVARKIKQQTIQKLSVGLANIANTFDPDIIVLGGGVSNLQFYSQINKEAKIYVKSNRIKVVKNKLGDSSGVLGAAALSF